jgi:hypothetical protein
MSERRVLQGWKEISTYLKRGVRTAQRWELTYRMPVHRIEADVRSVFAYADELDAWLERSHVKSAPYVRPTVLMVDLALPNALSDLKLALESAKFNVLTAFTSAELYATAAKFDVDAFLVDSVLIDVQLPEVSQELRKRYPSKPLLLAGDDPVEGYDAIISADQPSKVVEWMIERLGMPQLTDLQNA